MDPALCRQPWDEEGGFSQRKIDTGKEVTHTVLGSAQKLGPHQPRCDLGFWTVNRDELMDPFETGDRYAQVLLGDPEGDGIWLAWGGAGRSGAVAGASDGHEYA